MTPTRTLLGGVIDGVMSGAPLRRECVDIAQWQRWGEKCVTQPLDESECRNSSLVDITNVFIPHPYPMHRA
jgi:hypothetical protein